MCFTKRTMMFYHMEIKIKLVSPFKCFTKKTMIFYRMKIKMFLYIETGISSFFLHENKFQQVFLVFQGKLNPRGQKILNALEHFY